MTALEERLTAAMLVHHAEIETMLAGDPDYEPLYFALRNEPAYAAAIARGSIMAVLADLANWVSDHWAEEGSRLDMAADLTARLKAWQSVTTKGTG